MAGPLARAFVELRLDGSKLNSDLKQSLGQVSRSASTAGSNVSRSLSKPLASTSTGLADIGKNAGKATAGLKDVSKGAGKASSSIKGIIGAAAGFTTIVGLAGALKSAVSAAAESAKIGRLTEAVIKSTGHEAGITATQVSDLATAISNKTGIDDEAIQSGENLLLTFTNIRNEVGKGNDIFNQATGLITDMSAALGTDLSGSAIQLGKALNDPIKGVSALSRVGVSFTEQQKAQIAVLIKTGDTLGAQKIILRELGKEFGGAAAAASDPMARLQVIVGNLQEKIGGALLPTVNSAADFLGRNLPVAIDKTLAVMHGLSTILGPVARAFEALPGPVQGTVFALVGVAAAVRPAQRLITGFANTFAPAINILKKVRPAFDNLRIGMLGVTEQGAGFSNRIGGIINKVGGLGPALGIAGAAVAAIGISWAAWKIGDDKKKEKLAEIQRSVKAIGDEAIRSGQTVASVFRGTELFKFFDDNRKLFDKVGASIGDVDKALEGTSGQFSAFYLAADKKISTDQSTKLIKGLREERNILKDAKGYAEKHSAELNALHLNTDLTAQSAKQHADALAKASGVTAAATVTINAHSAAERNANAALLAWRKETETAKAAMDTLKAAIDGVTNSAFATQTASDAVHTALNALPAAIYAVHTSGTGMANVLLKNSNEAIGLRASLASVVTAGGGLIKTWVDQGIKGGELSGKVRFLSASLVEQAVKMGVPRYAAALYINTLLKIPGKVQTDVQVKTEAALAAVRRVKEAFSGLGRVGAAVVLANTRATGGPVKAGSPYIVGERRPELFVPDRNGTILPRVPSRYALAVGGVVLPRPGGTSVTLGEAGKAEAVVPLSPAFLAGLAAIAHSRAGGGGDTINVSVHGNDQPRTTAAETIRQLRTARFRTGRSLVAPPTFAPRVA